MSFGNPDDRKFTTGFGIFHASCLISRGAKKQAVVSRSSTEAEYHALAITTVELYWLDMLLKELQIALPFPPVLCCDNLSVLALASNPIFHARTKHIKVDYHFVRDKVVNGDIVIKFVPTLSQAADLFTKGYTAACFLQLRHKLMICPCPLSLQGLLK